MLSHSVCIWCIHCKYLNIGNFPGNGNMYRFFKGLTGGRGKTLASTSQLSCCLRFDSCFIVKKISVTLHQFLVPGGHIAHLVNCQATDACLAADPGVASSIRPGPILSWRLIMH